MLSSSLDESHGLSKQVRGCIWGTNHLCSDRCGPCNRGEEDTRRMGSPKGGLAEDFPARRRSRTGLDGLVHIGERHVNGPPLQMSRGDARCCVIGRDHKCSLVVDHHPSPWAAEDAPPVRRTSARRGPFKIARLRIPSAARGRAVVGMGAHERLKTSIAGEQRAVLLRSICL